LKSLRALAALLLCGSSVAVLLGDKDRLPDGVVRSGVSSVIVRYGVGAQVRF